VIAKAHNLVTASRVKGADVFDATGKSIGHVRDLSIDKASGQVLYALVSFGGFLGIGDRYHAVPWSMMHYDVSMDGYIVPLGQAELSAAPSYNHDELIAFGDDSTSLIKQMFDYYGDV
jgi:sporulation protein YlmC with PRC-barrel domain